MRPGWAGGPLSRPRGSRSVPCSRCRSMASGLFPRGVKS
ncbi:hypothetical protein DXT68_14270 [Microbacterium foliorum]|nr:hypothetical protein DXT68_14270 [Microbacterium foliorum]